MVFLFCSELVRYRQFLGIQKEQQNIREEQEKLKMSFRAGKDIVSPDNLNTINQAKAEGTPADRYLSCCLALHVPMQRGLARTFRSALREGIYGVMLCHAV